MAIIRLRMVSPSNQAPYSIEELARLGGVPPALVQRYLDEGLLEPVAGNARTAWFFDRYSSLIFAFSTTCFQLAISRIMNARKPAASW